MSTTVGKPPNLRKARKRDAIDEARARRADEYTRDPKRERQAIIRFLAYIKPHLGLFTFATLCGMANYALQAVVPSVTGYTLDRILGFGASKHGKTNALYPVFDHILNYLSPHASLSHKADVLLGALMVFLVLVGGIVFTRGWLTNVGGTRVIFKLRSDLYEHIQSLSLSFFHQNRSGSIVSRLTSDISLAQNFIGNACTLLWMDSLSVVGVVIWLFCLDRPMALVSLTILPIWVTCVRFFGQRIRESSLAVQDGLSELSGQVQEKVAGATVVQAFAREKWEQRLFHRLHKSLFHRQVITVRYQALNMAVSNVLTSVAPVTVFLYGTHRVLSGQMTPGMAITVELYVGGDSAQATASFAFPFKGSQQLKPASGDYGVTLSL